MCQNMKQDTELTTFVATYYFVEFEKFEEPGEGQRPLPAGGYEQYEDLVGKKFIFRCHKKIKLDAFTANLKLCFDNDICTTAEHNDMKFPGLVARIDIVEPLLKKTLENHCVIKGTHNFDN